VIRTGPKNTTPHVEEKICKIYIDEPELTARTIAERFGINVSTVYAFARQRGLSRKHIVRSPYPRQCRQGAGG
jgi:hypothetical protein